jgi:hypothetical protein
MQRNENDIAILRQLAMQVSDISRKASQEEKRNLWRRHNSLAHTRPLIYVMTGSWDAGATELVSRSDILCEDPIYRDIEFDLRLKIFKDSIEDDEIIEPWITVKPIFDHSGLSESYRFDPGEYEGGAGRYLPVLAQNEDIRKLGRPSFIVDESRTKDKITRIEDAIGDIIEINKERTPGIDDSLCWDLCNLVGREELLYYFFDSPDWIHEILSFLRDSVSEIQLEAERKGDWRMTASNTQSMAYSEELPDPAANTKAEMNQLWAYANAQDYAMVSPEMTDEFLLQYQIPLLSRFGLVAYGCCEDLTRKIHLLKQIPNLRRIAVSPWADLAACAEQIENDYVISWRPNPSPHISTDWDPEFVSRSLKEGMKAVQGGIVDITLKDIQTVRGEVWRVKEWVKIARDVCQQY